MACLCLAWSGLCLAWRACAWPDLPVPGLACLCLACPAMPWPGLRVPAQAWLCPARSGLVAWPGLAAPVPGLAWLCLAWPAYALVLAWAYLGLPEPAWACLSF